MSRPLFTRIPLRAPWLSLGLTAVVFAIDRLGVDWALRRDAVLGGDVLRLVTGHFTHFSFEHLLADALAFTVWAALVEQVSRRFLMTTLVLTSLVSSVAVLVCVPGASEYRGLAVVDCALAAQLVALGWIRGRRAGDAFGMAAFGVLGVGLIGRTIFELSTGRAVLSPDLGVHAGLLPVSHVLGLACGLAIVAVDDIARLSPLGRPGWQEA